MTERETLTSLKASAKMIARARRMTHVKALDLIAAQIGFAHWHRLTFELKNGWRPDQDQLKLLDDLVDAANPLKPDASGSVDIRQLLAIDGVKVDGLEPASTIGFDDDSPPEIFGEIDGQAFRLSLEFHDVLLEGRGWRIIVREAPSAVAEIEITDRRIKSNAIVNGAFREKALRVAQLRAEQVRARIASEWPRNSLHADADGNVGHPLKVGKPANQWYCLHCEGVFTGAAIANNFWHCPACCASPLDIMSPPEVTEVG